jgi:plasmid stabilization system protein ParE
MTRRFVLRPRAERDIQSTFEWYESQRSGLGDEFLASLRERLETVRSFPEAFPVLYRDFRTLSSTLRSRLVLPCSR